MAHTLADSLNDALGDIMMRDTLGDALGDTLADDESDRYAAASAASAARRRSSDWVPAAGTPMRAIMDGATVPTLPRYIFKAHEMTQSVRNILQECLHTDVILVAADEEVPAHSKVLKEHGGALFAMAEATGPDGRVPLPDMSGEVLLELLRFVYTATAPAVGRMPRALMAAAHTAGLAELKGRCAEVLVQRLDVHNVTEIFELADKNEEERLKRAAAVLFLENAQEVYETEEWHAALDLRPAAVMRLVHIAVTKTATDFGSLSTGTRIVHLIARIYMVAIVPVVGYVLYATVRNKLKAFKEGNSTATVPTTAAEVVTTVVAAVNQSAAAALGLEEDDFFASTNDEL
ncbi:speckle-type POZ protein-like [Thrips palmi]|uniref:Speckle-type POZ protein-like n=1 Tax=Thrips palmi TaxID=161013 RepID=A0A6P8ZKQ9_THRPL|nr:speckle-type POZ protein-like [Thrips palmi]